jgi:MHS family citrate/tricarballylate:H+ symporter-like MFS transporter
MACGGLKPKMVMLTAAERKSKLWSVVRVSSGNFLEMYDFMVYGYYATAIAKAFFPDRQ